MKKIMMTLAVAFLGIITVSADNDQPINTNQLPAQAKMFLDKNFKGKKIAATTTERDWFSKEYNVIFADGSKIEFDSEGNWENIDCNRSSVPESALPAAIASYLKANYAGIKVKEIDLDFRGYDVDLENGLEIKFNKDGKFLRIES